MALITAAAFKTEVAAMATALSAVYKDSSAARMPLEISNPMHPLRQIDKYFNFDANTGIVTPDDAYVDAAYAGRTPSKANPFDKVANFDVLALTTVTVETGNPRDIVLTFSRNVANASSVTIGGAASAGKSIVSVTIASAVVTVVVSADYIAAGVITVSGDFRTEDSAKLVLSGESVTNNIV